MSQCIGINIVAWGVLLMLCTSQCAAALTGGWYKWWWQRHGMAVDVALSLSSRNGSPHPQMDRDRMKEQGGAHKRMGMA